MEADHGDVQDIPSLVQHFAMDYADRMGKPITAISEEFMAALVRHSRPGNVRELQNLIERSVILATGAVLNGSLPGDEIKPQSTHHANRRTVYRNHFTRVPPENVETGKVYRSQSKGSPRTGNLAKTKTLTMDFG